MTKKYDNPELILTKCEADEELAAGLDISRVYDDTNTTDKDSWDNMFGGNN